MSLILAGRLIQSPEDISEVARLALHLVDGGTHWVRWAIAEPGPRYEFADESLMAGAVQQGLHGDRLTLLRRLQLVISPLKLMTLGLSDLRILVRAEDGETGPKFDAQLENVLDAHGIRTQVELQKAEAFLEELGVGGGPGVQPDPLFQVLTLSDKLAFYDLLCAPDEPDTSDLTLQKEAAAWAVVEARTPQEFIDYLQVYLALAAKFGTKADTPAKRHAHAERALHALLPPLLGAIDCPEVPGLVAPEEVAEALKTWASWGRPLGFSRISAGVREVVLHTKYRAETGAEAREYVALYVAAAQSMLAAAPLRWGIMAQDGATCRYPVHSGDHEGEVVLSATGVISLAWFRRKPKPKPPAAQPSAAAQPEPTS